MTENATTLAPSLVLSIGKLANRVAIDVQTLLLRSDPWRVRAVKFLTLTGAEAGFAWVQTRAGRARQNPQQTRAQICAKMLKPAEGWQVELENSLHELRSHAQVLQVGGEARVPQALQVIVLADLREALAAALFPLAAGLQTLLAREPYSQVSLLLNVADFTPSATREAVWACRAANLKDLHSLFSLHSPLRERLAAELQLQTLPPPSAQVYLFDRYKEGGWEVKDEAELGVSLGNFVLALLTGETGGFNSAMGPSEEPLYNGAGASALVYDPAELMDTCAARLGAEVLRTEFGAETLPELRAVHETAEELAGLYSNLPGWLASLLEETPFTLRAGAEAGLEIHFADPSTGFRQAQPESSGQALAFDDLPVEEWGDAISGHDRHFGENVFPTAAEKLLANAQKLRATVSGAQADALELLPQRERLYPGGLEAARKVLELLGLRLRERQAAYRPLDETEATEQTLQKKVEITLRLLDQAVEGLPQPPRWFHLLPGPVNRLARFLFALLYQRQELARLVWLRENAIRAVETKYATLLERTARQQVQELCQGLLEALKQGDQELQILQAAIYSAQVRLEKRAGMPGRMATPFRQPAVERAVYAWAFARGQKPAAETRLLLLEEHSLLAEWKKLDARKIEAALFSFARGMYQFTWQLTLDEVLAQRGDPDLQGLWTVLTQGAAPLLRPDFDQVPIDSTQRPGAGGPALQGQHFLCQSVKSTPFAAYLREPLAGWQAHSTSDPYLAFCVRLRQGLPLAALSCLHEKAAGKPETGHRDGLALFEGDVERDA